MLKKTNRLMKYQLVMKKTTEKILRKKDFKHEYMQMRHCDF